jgi:hypothetical protein
MKILKWNQRMALFSFFLIFIIKFSFGEEIPNNPEPESQPALPVGNGNSDRDADIDFPQPPPIQFPEVTTTTTATTTTTTTITAATTVEPISSTEDTTLMSTSEISITNKSVPIQRIKIFPVYRRGVGYCCRDVRKSNGKKLSE